LLLVFFGGFSLLSPVILLVRDFVLRLAGA